MQARTSLPQHAGGQTQPQEHADVTWPWLTARILTLRGVPMGELQGVWGIAGGDLQPWCSPLKPAPYLLMSFESASFVGVLCA